MPDSALTFTRRNGVEIAVIAACYFLASTPGFLNFFRALPITTTIAVLGIVLAHRRIGGVRTVLLPVVPLLFLAWCAISTVWSENRMITVIQVVSSGLAIIGGTILGSTVRLRVLLWGFVVGGVVVALMSIAAAVISPGLALEPVGYYQGGALRGLYTQRNVLSAALAPAVIAIVCLAPNTKRQVLAFVAALAVLVTGLLLTRSSTALAACSFGVGLSVVLRLIQAYPTRFRAAPTLLAGMILTGTGLFLLSNQDVIFGLLGRDDSLTGRLVIWNAVNDLIARQPILGYGWGAAWGVEGFVQHFVEVKSGFPVPHAHSGYLNLLVQVGWVGLVLFLLILVLLLIAGIRAVLRSEIREFRWLVVLPAVLIVYNYDETTFENTLILFVLLATWAQVASRRRTPQHVALRPLELARQR